MPPHFGKMGGKGKPPAFSPLVGEMPGRAERAFGYDTQGYPAAG